MERLKCLFVVGALAVVVSVVGAGPAFAAKGGNNDTAKACQQGGWKTLVPDAGGTFANQGDCVNDGAKGSAPFGAAGKAACGALRGAFILVPEFWTCAWNVLAGSGSSLGEACRTDLGEYQQEMLEPDDIMAMCVRPPQPAT